MLFLLKSFFSLFFDKVYLNTKWFEKSNSVGWKWCVRALLFQKIIGFNRNCNFPVAHSTTLTNFKNIVFHPENIDNFQMNGCYFQSYHSKIFLGRGTLIAANTAFITSNHLPTSINQYQKGSPIIIGENCWIGFGAVILPGVTIANNSVVAANAVVNSSFFEEGILIAGVPARKKKKY